MNPILTFLFSEKGKGQIRHIFTFAAGFLVAKGVFSQDVADQIANNIDPLLTSIGALIGIIGAVWSAKSKNTTDNP